MNTYSEVMPAVQQDAAARQEALLMRSERVYPAAGVVQN